MIYSFQLKFIIFFIFTLLVFVFSGCQSGCLPVPASEPTLSPCEQKVTESFRQAGLRMTIIGNAKKAENTVVILAGLRTDETASVRLIMELDRKLRRQPSKIKNRRLLIVPAFNGKDVNRDFLDKTNPETVAFLELLNCFEPDWIIALREFEQVDFDPSPNSKNQDLRQAGKIAKGIAGLMSKYSRGLRVGRLGSERGSLGFYAGQVKRIPTISFGLPKSANQLPSSKLWELYERALLSGISATVKVSNLPAKFFEARKLFKKGQYYPASKIFKEIMPCKNCDYYLQKSITAISIIQKGKRAIKEGRKDWLRTAIKELQLINPEDPIINRWRRSLEKPQPKRIPKDLFRHGKTACSQGKWKRGINYLNQALRKDPNCQPCKELKQECQLARWNYFYQQGMKKYREGKIKAALDNWLQVPAGFRDIDSLVETNCSQILLLTGQSHPRCR